MKAPAALTGIDAVSPQANPFFLESSAIWSDFEWPPLIESEIDCLILKI